MKIFKALVVFDDSSYMNYVLLHMQVRAFKMFGSYNASLNAFEYEATVLVTRCDDLI